MKKCKSSVFNPHKIKKSPEELREWLAFKRKGFSVPAKKGKGSYKRKKKIKEEE